MRYSLSLAASLLAFAPAAAFAQSANAPEGSALDGDYLIVGAGAAYTPSYEGSDDYIVTPIPIVQGNLAGVAITPRPGGVALDFIPDGKDPKFGFSLGPVATFSGNRHSRIKDPVVRASGKLKNAVDAGVNGGFTAYKLLNPYDSLTISADVKWNVNKASRGMVITPAVSYTTPLSKGILVSLTANLKHVDDDYANYYYTVTPTQSAATAGALPVYQSKGGWVGYGLNGLVGIDLDGDITNGGVSAFVLGGYTKLTGEAKRTPFTSLRGDSSQWRIGAGLAYTF
jgi:outer membrane scaffolding protein for murein synthesis (MipA/OmpV family)